MKILLYNGSYEGDKDEKYESTRMYYFWMKVNIDGSIDIKQQNDTDGSTKRHYANIVDFFEDWGRVRKDCRNLEYGK